MSEEDQTQETQLSPYLRRIHRIQTSTRAFSAIFVLLKALVLGFLALSVWALISPQSYMEQIALAIVTFVATLVAGRHPKEKLVQAKDLLLSLEMENPEQRVSAFSLNEPEYGATAQASDWASTLETWIDKFEAEHRKRGLAMLSSLVAPLLIATMAYSLNPPSLSRAFEQVKLVVSRIGQGAKLSVKQGYVGEEKLPETMDLKTSKPLNLQLSEPNLIEITYTLAKDTNAPQIILKRPATSQAEDAQDLTYQTFQMSAVNDVSQEASLNQSFKLQFAVDETVEIYVSNISTSKPVALLQVAKLPVPVVALSTTANIKEIWPDDSPLPLMIKANAQNPLQAIRLVIRIGKRVNQELVSRVMAEDVNDVETDYRLLLEPYMQDDIADVEIVAEAIDRAIPAPLVGRSNPIFLRVASAYGRYRQALQTLGTLKQQLDAKVANQTPKIDDEAIETMDKALEEAKSSPFFDGLDRVQLFDFAAKTKDLAKAPDMEKLIGLSTELNQFLFEHEILNDRERDRDFFVAARSLSRLIEKEPQDRAIPVERVTERISKFLESRRERWKLRVGFLAKNQQPKSWPKVQNDKPFLNAMSKISKLSASFSLANQSESLSTLSKSVASYKQWIQELEAKEDEARRQQDENRQKGIANARNQIRELQKRQGKISSYLDKAVEKQPDQLALNWPSNRMEQNTNIDGAKKLEGQLRQLSPMASLRIEAALKSMRETVDTGNKNEFNEAESFSDLAGRLLRQADSAAQKSQSKRQGRGNRRRIAGDNYFGQSVVGGDIEISREYEVDPRFRENILDSIRRSNLHEENKELLEDYLRKVVR